MATKAVYRPGRWLLVLVVILGGLYALIISAGWKPRLGLDLKGGTSVILTPNVEKSGGKVAKGNLDKAVDIIRNRVNGFGVAEAEVVTQGENVVIALPAVGRDDALKLVGRTAQLTFRGVIGQPIPTGAITDPSASPSASGSVKPSASSTAQPTTSASVSPSATASRPANPRVMPFAQPSPSASVTPSASVRPTVSGSPSASASPGVSTEGRDATQADQLLFDCSDAERVAAQDDPKHAIVACSRDGSLKYLLGAAEVVGSDVKDANATIEGGQASTGQWVVELEMSDKGKKAFADATTKHVNQALAIVLDGIVQSAPTVQNPITDGRAQITGQFTSRDARDLANVLKYGALPVVFDQSQTLTISPTLGNESLRGGIQAGLLGIALVVILLVAFYRGLGIVTVLGLATFAALNYALVVFLGEEIGFTLTLAGIAGLIISVGITADSYVVYFERIKDELASGRNPRASVDRAFSAAFKTILAGDSVSFLAAATLYVLSVGAVRGFAFTLGLSTLLDVFMVLFFTRPLTTILARRPKFAEGRRLGLRSLLRGPKTEEAAA